MDPTSSPQVVGAYRARVAPGVRGAHGGRDVDGGRCGSAVFLALAGAELVGILGTLLAIPVGAALNVVLRDLLEECRSKGGLTAPEKIAVADRPMPSGSVEGRPDRALVDVHGRPLVVTRGLDEGQPHD